MHHLSSGTLLQGGRYEIKRFVASGGFGCTYEGIHTGLDKRVAIKEFFVKDFCNRDETTSKITVGVTAKTALFQKLRRKFVEEARALCKLDHPNIVKVSDVFDENGTSYFVMDYIDGPTLKDIVDQKGPFLEKDAVSFVLQVADALAYVHKHNRLHLDVKPGNIMVNAKGEAQLIDFGASKQYEEESGENTSTVAGYTVGYAPIEQMGNDIKTFSPATDVYSLGATLYYILSGIKPISAALVASGERLKPLPESISSITRSAVGKAMQINKNLRPQTMEEFASLLKTDEETVLPKTNDDAGTEKGKPVQILESSPKKPESIIMLGQKCFRRKYIVGIVSAIIVLIVIIVTFSESKLVATNGNVATDSLAKESIVNDEVLKLTANGVDFKMCYVKGGSFKMGATTEQGQEAEEDEKPVHQVTLDDYYIGQTEVTQALWTAIMGSNPSEYKGENLPVECITWGDCQTFIDKLNIITGKTFRLPTEAEWEFAARGGNKSLGYKYSGSNNIEDVAWPDSAIDNTTNIVATKKANELDIHDMNGNVWEWCSDWYGEYSASSQTNPTGPDSGPSRVVRGGSWTFEKGICRLASRLNCSPDYKHYGLGFRLVLVP